MIVQMKKVSIVVMYNEKKQVLRQLRKLGVLHIQAMQGSGARLEGLNREISALENAAALVEGRLNKNTVQKELSQEEARALPEKINRLIERRAACFEEIILKKTELERLKNWGALDPEQFDTLAKEGVTLSLYEMPRNEYEKLSENVTTVFLDGDKSTVRAVRVIFDASSDEDVAWADRYIVRLPIASTSEIYDQLCEAQTLLKDLDEQLAEMACYISTIKAAVKALQKEVEFEVYATGMSEQSLSESGKDSFKVAYFVGYLPTEELGKLFAVAKEHSWGIMAEDPTPDDPVPTKLQNNKFVSLIYPLTDFLGTVPGYFEYDISAWFLGFILIFFGIIFGDGGYGLLICAIAGVPIISALVKKKPVPPTFLLIELMGAATVLWGMLTCTWFAISPELLPKFLQNLSIPFISNVYADKIWHLPWTSGDVGLTTSQNVQIVCFSLALIQLSCAHFMGMARNRKSLKCLADLGSVLQLFGIFYVVLSLVVNGAVFPLNLSVFGVPISVIAVSLVVVGFFLNFCFVNYEGNLIRSIVSNLKNIVSSLLGIVNVFSDIVSYIRLWAVGLAGAAIAATVNELASPMLGNFLFIVFAIVILVFGHGLNIILNVLSLVVHGVRLNTLEFSTHLDMSWSGHKYQPFEE